MAEQYDFPLLAMGQVMQSQGLTAEDIQTLFFNEGSGYLTEEGHRYFADMMFDCFYDDGGTAPVGCRQSEDNR